MQEGLLFITFSVKFLLLEIFFAEPRLGAKLAVQNALAYSEGFGRDLQKLVVADVLERLFETEPLGRDETERVVGRGRARIRSFQPRGRPAALLPSAHS